MHPEPTASIKQTLVSRYPKQYSKASSFREELMPVPMLMLLILRLGLGLGWAGLPTLAVSLTLTHTRSSPISKEVWQAKPGRAKPPKGSIVPILIKPATASLLYLCTLPTCTEEHLLNAAKCKTLIDNSGQVKSITLGQTCERSRCTKGGNCVAFFGTCQPPTICQ